MHTKVLITKSFYFYSNVSHLPTLSCLYSLKQPQEMEDDKESSSKEDEEEEEIEESTR